ncbi:uncharacterized protein METZ01_LOCUS77783 [marine metagenome]|uniref:Uncharacterized protein n=1 Tax=marine metagenome TaxID=408172 RepID=A0A381U9T9_9ZZZZ
MPPGTHKQTSVTSSFQNIPNRQYVDDVPKHPHLICGHVRHTYPGGNRT